MSKETLDDNFGDNLAIYDDLQTDSSFDLEARLLSSDGISSSLPSLSFAAKATFSRDGNDLVLTLEGESVVVSNYFATPNPPALTTMDGAVLTPQMIASFLQNGDAQDFYASSLLKSLLGGNKPLDNNAVAVVENLEGSVLVIRNGKAIALQDGAQLYQGDEIATAADSSASMTFADGTQFKIGGEARISLDQFSYESSTSQGLQVLSILSGAFSYISGLVAKGDPANVQLRTPIGEIGIRGTKIVGEVDAESAEASITLLEGRILYTTPQGEQHEISQGFGTLTIKNGGDKVKESSISAEKAARSYDVFENADEVTNFLQQEPATQQEQGAGADLPLPDISYSQAQADLKALVESDSENALEGGDDEEKRTELTEKTAEKDETEGNEIPKEEDEPITDSGSGNTTPSKTATSKLPPSVPTPSVPVAKTFDIDLADRKVWTDAEYGLKSGDTFNFDFTGGTADNIDLNFYIGDYAGATESNVFATIHYQYGDKVKILTWKAASNDLESNSDDLSEGATLYDGANDLLIKVSFDDPSKNSYIVLDDYFTDKPAYSISINSGDGTALEIYNDEIKDLLST